MQISDLVGQYQHNTTASKAQLKGTKGIQKLVSSLRELGTGNIFEGTVNSVKGNQVTLGLSNGQEISARLDGKVTLAKGDSMFFQVKSNDGSTIAIRPFTVDGNSANLTLMQALSEAGLPAEGRNLSMVNSMMQEQLSIDKTSLLQMAKVIAGHPDINVSTLVQMQKLNLPITPEMASQFENYMDDKQAIVHALDDFILELPNALSSENLSAGQMRTLGTELMQILTEGLSEPLTFTEAENGIAKEVIAPEQQGVQGELEAQPQGSQSAQDAQAQGSQGAQGTQGTQDAQAQGSQSAQDVQVQGSQNAQDVQAQGNQNAQDVQAQESQSAQGVQAQGNQSAQGTQAQETQDVLDAKQQGEPVQKQEETVAAGAIGQEHTGERSATLGNLLSGKELENVNRQLLLLPDAKPLTEEDNVVSAFHKIMQAISGETEVDRNILKNLFSGKEFRTLLLEAGRQQWAIRPQELTKPNAVQELYEKLENQLGRLEHAVRAAGQEAPQLSQMAAEIRSNIEFMDQINQNYTYVQIPLQMSGQNASGELYVYTNKKALAEGTKELTAFLHLDMDHLGATDVSVKMRDKNVSTNFYFDNDEAYALVSEYTPLLDARLKEKGYRSEIRVSCEKNTVNFVEDFLKKDQPSAGQVHRYSFDMRA